MNREFEKYLSGIAGDIETNSTEAEATYKRVMEAIGGNDNAGADIGAEAAEANAKAMAEAAEAEAGASAEAAEAEAEAGACEEAAEAEAESIKENGAETEGGAEEVTDIEYVSVNNDSKNKDSKRKKRYSRISALVAACLVLTFCFWKVEFTGRDFNRDSSESNTGAEETNVLTASAYSDVFDAVNEILQKNGKYEYARASGVDVMVDSAEAENGMMTNQSMADEASAPTSTESIASADTGASMDTESSVEKQDYSQTNTQVEDIDESDIVKTDGKYIYVLKDTELVILAADGTNTNVISRTTIIENQESDNSYRYPSGMYVYNNRVAIITDSYFAAYGARNEQEKLATDSISPSESRCEIIVLDTTTPEAPKILKETGQDGYLLDSRLIGNSLYLISNYYVYTWNSIEEDKPETYVPCVYDEVGGRVIEASSVCVMPESENTSYAVICKYNLETADLESELSVLGAGNTLYTSNENLYIANIKYDSEAGEPYKEDNYSVVEYHDKSSTEIIRIPLSEEKLTVASTGIIDGTLLNQFSMDEYNGNLRVVTTENENSYKIYTDEKRGWTNYEEGESRQDNSLIVLDMDLNKVGSVEGLGEDERVYSARFTGNIGYFVTFRETDPLFAVDLSNPTAPVVLDALKIPGFSSYLHPYSEGLLFGFGKDADEQTGMTNGLKLSMFDVSDPANVTEKNTLLLDEYDSEAVYNHKAILISAEKDLIAFPADGGYLVYGYSADEGFYKKGSFKTDDWIYNIRGLYIGDYIYICSVEGVMAVDMGTLDIAADIKF